MFSTPTSTLACPVLIVDDDEHTRLPLSLVLAHAGYPVSEAANGDDCLACLPTVQPRVILLDLNMPGRDGWSVLEALRSHGFKGGIIIITGYRDTSTIVRGLEAGADDYIAKPLEAPVVCARIEAVARRVIGSGAPRLLRLGDTTVDFAARLVTRAGGVTRLTKIEHRLLSVLASRIERAVSREELLLQVWGYSDTARTRTLDTHIWRLRQKLGESPTAARWVVTAPGGYRLTVKSAAISSPAANSTAA